MKKRVIVIQGVFCMVILISTMVLPKFDIPVLGSFYAEISAISSSSLQISDISAFAKKAFKAAENAPEKVINTIANVNSENQYGEPIDKRSDTSRMQVHAVCTGMVSRCGMNKEYGLYVVIIHDKAKSVYGHLSDIYVLNGERVQRGEVIGTYDKDCGEDFYYQLHKNM